ncbi:guanine-N(1)--methyltransferase-like protein [Mollisia scopiformis]|uniref:tRNA (guanine(37)-N1)-methyltransferase n=1 Tax=Mollisia scopiformis TaxID=149040 RepID=A0A132B9D5_MOLSC|nr:guanine-N(1)--methyltransferase-like protein [Mollisia scopiformis]KUJ08484.1 guanine-N(1)--methyltransferas-like protein [Mollisia scopiformis]
MEEENLARAFDTMSFLSPPIVRSAGAILDRSLFSKTFPITAARITNLKKISQYRAQLEKTRELLRLERITNVQPDPDPTLASKGAKCMLLSPDVKPGDSNTWSTSLRDAVQQKDVEVVPYGLKLDYNHWTYHDIMKSILPDEDQEEIPVGFAIVGHVAHLNLRDEYLKYKNLIAEVLVDKNPNIRTVINKVDDVGTHSEFRTFDYEVLAGPDDMDVEISEGDCIFRFNYSKVYWNSRLQTEHKRLVDSFNRGEVVCDVMAGVGPFAIPAGKKGVFVWANDLNPASYESMKDAIVRNKVQPFVRPHCEDGHTFIRSAADNLLSLTSTGQNTTTLPAKSHRPRPGAGPPPAPTVLTIPSTISHFVMNLPATAIDFLGSFNGFYAGHEALFAGDDAQARRLPMVHVHCFSTKSDDNLAESHEICERITEKLRYQVRPRIGQGRNVGIEDWEKLGLEEGEVLIREVRDVAPKKRMFCASFRIPREVAFRSR